jgi:Tat protein secretion system quality control protein TatD with DNase activity
VRRPVLALLIAVAALPAQAAAQDAPPPRSAPDVADEGHRTGLPRGGRELFPRYRVVAFAGTPGIPALGALGVGPLDAAVRRLRHQAREYRHWDRTVLPALDLITTIASSSPEHDGRYRFRRSRTIVRRHLRAARRARALLLIHIQPGRSTFLEELRPYRRFLDEPDVGVALDPEWRMGPGEVPGRTIGSADANEINGVARYLNRIVARHGLPQKLLVVHQFTEGMIRRRSRLRQRDGVAVTVSIDGVGSRSAKEGTYARLARAGDDLRDGFKLFYEEDGDVMTPRQVMRLRPRPDFVVYE